MAGEAFALNGKTVVITGGGRGLGQAYALAAAELGARIVAADVIPTDETVAAVGEKGGECVGVSLDVRDEDSCRAMAKAATDAFGRVDGLINNAALYGALTGGRFDAIDPGEWDDAMAVNVKGIWNCCKAVVPAMREAGGGSVINIASLAARFGMPYALHYTTSKAAVVGLTRGLAREIGRDNIRVNAMAPSAIITEGTREFFAAKLDNALDVIKNGQIIRRSMTPGRRDRHRDVAALRRQRLRHRPDHIGRWRDGACVAPFDRSLSRLLDEWEFDRRSGRCRGVSGPNGTVSPRHGRRRPTIPRFFVVPPRQKNSWMVGLRRP